MNITFQGNKITLYGNEIKACDYVPDFITIDNSMHPFTLKDTKGKRVFVTVPSVDTPVCDLEIRTFNKNISSLNDVTLYTVSMDLPFAQARWCGASGVNNIVTLSDFKDKNFGKNFGVYIEELGLLARAVFVVDETNRVTYVEYVTEVTAHPNYEKAMDAIKSL